MFFSIYTGAILTIASIAFAAFIIRKKPNDILARYFAAFVSSVALWNGAGVFSAIARSEFSVVFWGGTALIGASMMTSSYLGFVEVFVHKAAPKLWKLAVFFLPTAVFAAGAFSRFSVLEPILSPGEPAGFIPGILYGWLHYFILAALAYATALLGWHFFRRSEALERRQTAAIWLAFVVMLAGLMIFGSADPFSSEEFRSHGIAPQSAFFMIIIASYAIIRYRLFDIDMLVKRGSVFTLLFLIVFFIISSLVTLLVYIVPSLTAYFAGALAITLICRPLERWLEKLTDRIFFRQKKPFEQLVSILNDHLAKIETLDGFAGSIASFLREDMRIEKVGLLVADERGTLEAFKGAGKKLRSVKLASDSAILGYLGHCGEQEELDPFEPIERDDLRYRLDYEYLPAKRRGYFEAIMEELDSLGYRAAVPFRSDGKTIGLIFLGERRSGDPYKASELRMMRLLSRQGSIALDKAIAADRRMRLNELKTEFIRVVSHQLRTPLSAAIWNMEKVLERNEDEGIEEPVKDLGINLQKLHDGLDSMLTVLSLAKENVQLEREPSDFEEDLLKPVLKKVRLRAEKKRIGFDIASESDLPPCYADPDKLRNVVSILIMNAISYSPPGSKVTIEAQERTGRVEVAVKDRGPGVLKKFRKAIFDKFFRGPEAKKLNPDGLAVNLYIARQFVLRHGGEMWVTDRQDGVGGARFAFTIPTIS